MPHTKEMTNMAVHTRYLADKLRESAARLDDIASKMEQSKNPMLAADVSAVMQALAGSSRMDEIIHIAIRATLKEADHLASQD
ncbi:hypothetical protein [Aeromonas veronii]|uniref:Uncharacterized protein n=1 Tax=Aeromonas veronii TaxID=654 RepID=A0A2T4MWR2_AERVE|nr:hypothetical protein [Aeromonas veronii]PTH79027.1 hypothetical protein DAA48_21560 [Aeromonas veronii]